jgi:hypothetical protein
MGVLRTVRTAARRASPGIAHWTLLTLNVAAAAGTISSSYLCRQPADMPIVHHLVLPVCSVHAPYTMTAALWNREGRLLGNGNDRNVAFVGSVDTDVLRRFSASTHRHRVSVSFPAMMEIYSKLLCMKYDLRSMRVCTHRAMKRRRFYRSQANACLATVCRRQNSHN